MTYGLRQSGINVVAGVDAEPSCRETFEANNPGATFILSDIKRLRSNFFERNFGIRKNDDELILVGCSPCQYYSIINTERTRSVQTKNLLLSFCRFVDYYRPGFVLVENVPGIEYTADSVLPKFIKKLKTIGYQVKKKKYENFSKCKYKVQGFSRGYLIFELLPNGISFVVNKVARKWSLLDSIAKVLDYNISLHCFLKIEGAISL